MILVRYMIVCNDWHADSDQPNLLHVSGLLYSLRPAANQAYPIRYPELCVRLALTDCRGQGEGWIVCENEDTGQPAFASSRRTIAFGADSHKNGARPRHDVFGTTRRSIASCRPRCVP